MIFPTQSILIGHVVCIDHSFLHTKERYICMVCADIKISVEITCLDVLPGDVLP